MATLILLSDTIRMLPAATLTAIVTIAYNSALGTVWISPTNGKDAANWTEKSASIDVNITAEHPHLLNSGKLPYLPPLASVPYRPEGHTWGSGANS